MDYAYEVAQIVVSSSYLVSLLEDEAKAKLGLINRSRIYLYFNMSYILHYKEIQLKRLKIELISINSKLFYRGTDLDEKEETKLKSEKLYKDKDSTRNFPSSAIWRHLENKEAASQASL